MGYFANGTMGEIYKAEYCDRCVHQKPDDGGCAVWLAQMLHNYGEARRPDSILHLLIPRSKSGGGNERCRMFYAADPGRCEDTPDMFAACPAGEGEGT